MKIIYVMTDNEYDAAMFESNFGTNPSIQLWNQIKQDGFLVADEDGTDVDLNVRALEFGEVDTNFIGFIKSTLMDYEMTKHTNFYIVKE